MRVLFLDIDGVLNSTRSCIAFGSYPTGTSPEDLAKFDHVSIGLVRAVVAAAHLQVVLSSSWRTTHGFAHLGAVFGLPIIGSTPVLRQVRGHEIAAWLDEHPEVEQYAIVDDNDEVLPAQRAHFVHVDGDNGVTLEDACRLGGIFGVSVYDAPTVRDGLMKVIAGS